ncbi:hypothetical protein SDC9_155225 [bioreactor metagenome]|uniref:Uncharacterized protein n=1 Tax=bioreactor metagenome TaxID=1076179 RepID=A0A645F2B9_9ZZZZ
MFGAAVPLNSYRPAVGMGQRRLERLCDPSAQIRAYLEAVDDHLDGMAAAFLEGRHGIEFEDLAIDPNPHETLGAQFGKQLMLLAFASGNHGSHDHQASLFG